MQAQIISALQSRIDKRAGKITSLEMFREGYLYLRRSKDRREVESELVELRSQQQLDKRTFAHILDLSRSVDYFNGLLDSFTEWE